jgi:hypothetical protein
MTQSADGDEQVPIHMEHKKETAKGGLCHGIRRISQASHKLVHSGTPSVRAGTPWRAEKECAARGSGRGARR